MNVINVSFVVRRDSEEYVLYELAESPSVFWVFSSAGDFLAIFSNLPEAYSYIAKLEKQAEDKRNKQAVDERAAMQATELAVEVELATAERLAAELALEKRLAAQQELISRGWELKDVRAKLEQARSRYREWRFAQNDSLGPK